MTDLFSKSYHRHLDSGLLSNGNACAVYLYLLRKAAFRDMHVGYHKATIFLKAGEVLAPRVKIASALDLTEKQVRGALTFLTKLKIITKNGANRRANNIAVYTFVVEGYSQITTVEGANLQGQQRAKSGPSEGQVRANPDSNKRDLETNKLNPMHPGPFEEAVRGYGEYPVYRLINGERQSTGKSQSHVSRIRQLMSTGYPFREAVQLKKRSGDKFPNLSTFLNDPPDINELRKAFKPAAPARCGPQDHSWGEPYMKKDGKLAGNKIKKCQKCPAWEIA